MKQALIASEISIALDKARKQKKIQNYLSVSRGENGEQAVIGVGQSIKKSFISDVRNSLANVNQDDYGSSPIRTDILDVL